MNGNDPLIEIENVTILHNGLKVLDSVSLTVSRGEFTAIVGPNGSGKSTLVKAVLGLIKPDCGKIRVFGVPVDQLHGQRSRIGYVPQIFNIDLNFPISVLETVLMGTYGRIGVGKRPKTEDKAAAMAALEKVGIADLKDRPLARLSGGQRQRVFIARALADQPELLVLDEPTTGVDMTTTGNLYSLLRELKNDGVTIVLVSHDVGVVASYIDTIACLNVSLVAHCRPDEEVCSRALTDMYGSHAAYFHHSDTPHIVVEEHPDA
ncbi:MAG: metal ABC transporter ATP-binding protein [Armatimonadetes bacterium]|nr:metal ABC transporter ATP-binding protein [Armatimonadota bacterium]